MGEVAADVGAIGIGVYSDGEAPADIGFDRDALENAGFTAKPGTSIVLPRGGRTRPRRRRSRGEGRCRGGRPARRRRDSRQGRVAAERRWVCGSTISREWMPQLPCARSPKGRCSLRYRYTVLNGSSKHVPLAAFTIDVPGGTTEPVAAALTSVRAAVVARDLANTPPGHLTAVNMGEIAVELGARFGFEGGALRQAGARRSLGCGGLLGVNQGSVEEPRMIKLVYTPDGAVAAHLGLVGKGIMYDSGGISLKPSDPMHLLMKMDMGGAAAVLGASSGSATPGSRPKWTGWLMCTDNMPSGTAYKLGDVLTARGGTTIEVKNTDAEGRLVMSDALVLATEDEVDAIIDIATLTGAALVSLGAATAPVFRQRPGDGSTWCARPPRLSTSRCGSCLWSRSTANSSTPRSPTSRTLGGPFAGATTAALFLEHFVGGTPWAHLDIAGTMQTEKDDSWPDGRCHGIRGAAAAGGGSHVRAGILRSDCAAGDGDAEGFATRRPVSRRVAGPRRARCRPGTRPVRPR